MGSVGSFGEGLSLVLNEISALVSFSGSSSADRRILSGTVVVVCLPESHERLACVTLGLGRRAQCF